MPIVPGARLGPYEIVAPIGAGGMGEVYRARDTRLERIVAIKVLPAHLAQNSEARRRFEREARAVSSLNHPHICTLHDIGSHDGIDFLVMECLEGETLAARLKRGPLPLDQSLRYATQVADALARAHRQGVFHRDLKPGNIMLTKSGAKLLDFGLARIRPAPPAPASDAATLTEALTREGVILGTLQYMAPEQLDGQDADARTDIFAFGAVLYEMVTGRRAFDGASKASIMSAILSGDPLPVVQLQPATPPGLERVIRKCLAKEPDRRWQTAADLKDELEWIAAGPAAPVSAGAARRRVSIAWLTAAILVVAGLGWTVYALRPTARDGRSYRLTILPPAGGTSVSNEQGRAQFALSPDGRSLAFIAVAQGMTQLYLRPVDSLEARLLATAGVTAYPFWSPDSQFVGFFADHKLKKVRAVGDSPPQVICDAPEGRGGTWNRAGVIVFCPAIGSTLHRVSASGGQPTPLTKLDPSRHEDAHYWPQFLPDGKRFLYFARSTEPQNSMIVAGTLQGDSPPEPLVKSVVMGVYANPGYLITVTEGALAAQRLDPRRLALTGEPVVIAVGMGAARNVGRPSFTVSENGVLAYRPSGTQERRLTWLGRQGQTLGVVGTPDAYGGFRLSPDQGRLAVEIFDSRRNSGDIWLMDLGRGVSSRFAFSTRDNQWPVWSPAADWIAFLSDRTAPANLYRKATSGAGHEERLLEKNRVQFTNDWSFDGRYLLYQERSPNAGWDLWMVPMTGVRNAAPFLQTPFDETQGQFSPDGRFVAYVSDEGHRNEVYIQTFPASAHRWQISTGGGSQPRWRRDGKELYFVAPGQALMAVEVRLTASGLALASTRTLFEHRALNGDGVYYTYDVSADGQRFLLAVPSGESGTDPIHVVINWPAALKN